jgi:hypothetical protein
MVELWVKSNTDELWYSLDIPSDVAISITKSFEEIEDFTTIKSSFSKTFDIPQTPTNNQFFKSAFMVNSSNFVDNIVVQSVVKYAGADVFNGDLRLNAINNSLDGGSYEIFLTQELPNLANTLEQIKLVDTDITELSHELDYDTIVSTWGYSGGSYTSYSGLTGKIVYPIGHYGYDDNQYYGRFDLSSSGFTNSGGALSVNQFTPWVNVKYLLDKCFQASNFTYESSFLESDYFTSLFTIAKANDTMGAKPSSANTENANVFLVENTTPFTDIGYGNQSFPGNFDEAYFAGFIFTDVLNDPLSIFSPSQNNSPSGRGHFFTPIVNGEYKFKVSYRARLQNALLGLYLNFAIKDVDDGTIYNQAKGLIIFNSTTDTEVNDFYINATIPAGRRVALFYSRNNGGGDPFADIVFTYQKWELWTSPLLTLSNNILLQDNLPREITCLDYFKGLMETFNLVVIPSGERNFLIEPWDSYFSSGNTLDWSNKLDLSSTSKLEPTNDLSKEYILQYTQTTDKLSDINIQNRNQVFGTKRFVDKQPFHTGIKTFTSVFEPLPISTFDDETESNILIPHLYDWKVASDENPAEYTPISSGLRLGWYNGLLDSKITGSTTPIYIISGNTPVSHTTYPAISHLSSYEFSASTFSDLSFKNQYDFWQVHNDTYVGYTDRDLYNDFWNTRITQLYEPDTKLFTGNFILTPVDIETINFNDKVYFQDAYWRLYEMTDADITSESLVSCKFLKIPYDVVEKIYISPTFIQSSGSTAPSPTGATFSQYYFSGNSALDICSGSVPVVELYSNCSVISDGCNLYTSSGVGSPVQEGLLVRNVSGSTIYQVIENGVITSIQNC